MGVTDWFRRSQGGSDGSVSPGGSRIIVRDRPAAPRLGVTEHQYTKEREVAYRELWGEPQFISHEIIAQIPHIDVYVYPPGFRDRACYTLVTGGMSDLRMKFPEDASPRLGRAELIIYVSEPKEDYVELLRTLAHHPHNHEGWMTHGYTIPNGHPPEPLFPNGELSVALLIETRSRSDAFLSELLEIEADRVELLELVPITARECELKLQAGCNALLDVFDRHRHPLILDESRGSYV